MLATATKTPADVRTSAPPPAPPESEAPATPERFEQIPIDQIEASPTNFRKAFDEDALEELASSIAVKGVIEPVIVRPKLSPVARNKREQAVAETLGIAGAPRYELVAGERRWRAAKLAGLKAVPAIVREYSDAAALEVQIIENDQRADISSMERARGFQMMLDKLGYTADEIAQKLHKSKTFVYSHLKLTRLPKAAAESLELGPDGGGISRSVAELIARIPDEKAREKAAKEIVQGNWRGAPMSYRAAKEHVESEYMKELKGAPFALDDAALLPAAGPCTACQHCSANTPEQYQGKRTDMCLLPPCFQQKVEAHHARALEKFRAAGHEIVPAAEAKAMFKHSDTYISGGNSKYALLSDSHWEAGTSRTHRSILGKAYKSIVAQTPRGTVVELCLKADVAKALNADRPKGAKPSPAHSTRDNRHDPERELMERAVPVAAGKLVEKIEAGDGTLPAELLRQIIKEQLDLGYDYDYVARRRGLACKEGDEEEAIEKLLPTLSHKQLLGLYVELTFLSHYWSRELHEEQRAMLKIFGVDFALIKAAEKKRRDEWQQKLKTATTAVVVEVEVAPARLTAGGDIVSAASLSQLAGGKPIKTFEYEGEIFTRADGRPAEFLRAGEFLEAVRVVPRASYKGKTFKYGERGLTSRGAYEGLLVKCDGAECVLTGPMLKCVPAGAKASAPKAAAKSPAKAPAKSKPAKAARAAAGRRS